MRSAALIAQQAKERQKEEVSPGGERGVLDTQGAHITAEARILIRDNPLRTTMEIHCTTCRLPRLYHPTTGRGARPPEPGREYCAKQPYIQKDGCDIYGKSLALEKLSKKSKAARALDVKGNVKDKKPDPSPNADGSDDEDDAENGRGDNGKPAATSIPNGKCPNCPRYMAFTRVAQHMDRCMGFSGRASSKNALSKMASGTPQNGSRAGTPKPSSQTGSVVGDPRGTATTTSTVPRKRKLERTSDDDDGDRDSSKAGTPTGGEKKKKKLLTVGKTKAVNASLQRVKSADKRLPTLGAREGSERGDKDEDDGG